MQPGLSRKVLLSNKYSSGGIWIVLIQYRQAGSNGSFSRTIQSSKICRQHQITKREDWLCSRTIHYRCAPPEHVICQWESSRWTDMLRSCNFKGHLCLPAAMLLIMRLNNICSVRGDQSRKKKSDDRNSFWHNSKSWTDWPTGPMPLAWLPLNPDGEPEQSVTTPCYQNMSFVTEKVPVRKSPAGGQWPWGLQLLSSTSTFTECYNRPPPPAPSNPPTCVCERSAQRRVLSPPGPTAPTPQSALALEPGARKLNQRGASEGFRPLKPLHCLQEASPHQPLYM